MLASCVDVIFVVGIAPAILAYLAIMMTTNWFQLLDLGSRPRIYMAAESAATAGETNFNFLLMIKFGTHERACCTVFEYSIDVGYYTGPTEFSHQRDILLALARIAGEYRVVHMV